MHDAIIHDMNLSSLLQVINTSMALKSFQNLLILVFLVFFSLERDDSNINDDDNDFEYGLHSSYQQ